MNGIITAVANSAEEPCESSVLRENTYYVSVDGDDTTDGRSPEASFGSLLEVINHVCPGDTITIRPGIYSEGIQVSGLGDRVAPIVIRGDGQGVIFDGQKQAPIGFWCEGCTGIIVDNITFQNYTDVGIGFLQSTDIRLSNLSVHNNGFAVQMAEWEFEGYGIQIDESEAVIIENSDVHANGPNPQIPPDYLMGTGINLYRCTDCIVRGNQSHNNVGGGILVEDSFNVSVEGNAVYENDLDASVDGWWDAGLWVDGGGDIMITDNIFYDNLGPGIEISDEDNQSPQGYVLENNVSTGNYFGIYIWNFGTTDLPPARVLTVINNVINNNTFRDIWISDWECPPEDPCG